MSWVTHGSHECDPYPTRPKPTPKCLGMGTANRFCGYRVPNVIYRVYFFCYLLHAIYKVSKACTCTYSPQNMQAHVRVLRGAHKGINGIDGMCLRGMHWSSMVSIMHV